MAIPPSTQNPPTLPAVTPTTDVQEAHSVATRRTAAALAYITSLLFFLLIFVIIIFGVGPLVGPGAPETGSPRAAESRATITVGGTSAENDRLFARFDLGTSKPPVVEVSYQVKSNDSLGAMASGLAAAISDDADLRKAGVTARADGPKITVAAPPTINLADRMSVFPQGTGETVAATPDATSAPASSADAAQQRPTASGLDIAGTRDLLFTLLGVVATGWATIIGYYFGSSSGSAQKSLILANALTQRGEDALRLSSAKVPSVASLSPNPLTYASRTQPLKIQGQNLDRVTSVRLSRGTERIDANVNRSSASSTAIECTIRETSESDRGDWDVILLDAAGTSTPSSQKLTIAPPL